MADTRQPGWLGAAAGIAILRKPARGRGRHVVAGRGIDAKSGQHLPKKAGGLRRISAPMPLRKVPPLLRIIPCAKSTGSINDPSTEVMTSAEAEGNRQN